MSDLGSRSAIDAFVDALLNDLVPDQSIEPSEHNQMVKNILDTLTGFDKTLREQNQTLGNNIVITEGDSIVYQNNTNELSLSTETLTSTRTQTHQDKDGILALLSDITGVVTHKIFVSVNGNDTTGDGSYSKPFLRITKGQTVASAGECVHVLPGTYTNDVSLGKDGVYYYFDMGAKVVPATPEGTIMWYLPTGINVKVGGYGEFVGGAIVRMEHASANLTMQCLRMERVNGVSLSTFPCITAFNGYMNILALKDITSNNHHTVNWRFNCGGVVEAKEFIKYKATDAYQATCVNVANVSSTDQITVKTPQIIVDVDPANIFINSAVGINVNTANILIDAGRITSNAPYYQDYNYGGTVTIGASNSGNITINGDISSTYSVGVLIFGSSVLGTAKININGKVKTTNNRAYVNSAPSSIVYMNGEIDGNGNSGSFPEAVSHGITGYFAYSGGGITYFNKTVRCSSSDAAGHAINDYSGTVVLGADCRLIVSNASAYGIYAASAINYKAVCVATNTSIHSNATNAITAIVSGGIPYITDPDLI